jgi:hypothetical protein
MADIASLFGLTPEGLAQQRYQQDLKQGYELAQLDPGAAARATLQSGVGQLGRGIAGMMGIEDPQMKLISARQSILSQTDQTDPASLLKSAKTLFDMGDQQGGFALADYARKAESEIAQAKQRLAAATREHQQAIPPDILKAQTEATLKAKIRELAGYEQTPEIANATAMLTDQLNALTRTKETAPNIKTVGVAEGPSKKAVLLDVNADQLFTYEIGADGKQYRKPYAGQVNRVTSTTTVGVKLPEQEKEEKGARGKMLVKQYEGVSDQARIAVRTLPSLESNLSILDKGFDTGFGTEVVAAGAKVLAALGVPEAERLATNAQTFLANANAAVLQRQLEQKGPQTESDAQRITTTGAQFGNTKEANRFLIGVAKAQLKRDIDQRNFYDKWWKTNSTYDGAEDAWFSGEGGRSLFDRPELKAYRVKESAASQIPSQMQNATNIPQAAIDALKRGAGTDAQFDALFGAGSAQRVKGGR